MSSTTFHVTPDCTTPARPPLQIAFQAQGHPSPATNTDVDAWELRASRRALSNLKSLLGQAEMLKLLEPQIREADTYYKSLLAASNGQFRESRTDLHIKGITATQIQDARKRWLSSGESAHFEQMMLQAHPEHYCLPPYEGEGIVEVIGEHMARLRVRPFTDVPQFVLDYGDPDFSFKKPTVLELDDGTVLSYILHEFRDTADGCDIILRLLLPMAMPETGIREHAEHLAIEFRSGITRAYEELNGAS